jgi:voltage-gated potassium channel
VKLEHRTQYLKQAWIATYQSRFLGLLRTLKNALYPRATLAKSDFGKSRSQWVRMRVAYLEHDSLGCAFHRFIATGYTLMESETCSDAPTLRRRVYVSLEPSARQQGGLSWTNKCLVIAILLATTLGVLATEKTIMVRYQKQIHMLEFALGAIFIIEYLARLWICVEQAKAPSSFQARLKFATSLPSLFDVLVIFAMFSPLFVSNMALLRIIRIFSILRLAKLGRISIAMTRLWGAIHSRRYELWLTLSLSFALILFGATALYWIEGELQPDKFGSIPRALWWAVITMTTIGYGDVFPLTPLGKIVASFVAIVGIGLIAMPTGILAAAFSDAMRKYDDAE